VVHHQGTDVINIGNTVVIEEGGKKYTYTIVGGYESDPSKMTISHISPIGKALMNKKLGDSFDVQTPRGSKRFTVLSIE
jgi:transcription elongation factor GreA